MAMSRANRRFYRTMVLGLVALALLIWTAIDQFGLSRAEMTDLLIGTLLAVAFTITCAALIAAVWVGLRRLFRGKRD